LASLAGNDTCQRSKVRLPATLSHALHLVISVLLSRRCIFWAGQTVFDTDRPADQSCKVPAMVLRICPVHVEFVVAGAPLRLCISTIDDLADFSLNGFESSG
jgi:hypothetical protein